MKLRELAHGRRDILMVDPRKLEVVDGFNVREEYGDLDALSASIIENGVRVALEVRMDGDRAIVIDGHRRLRATMMAIENGHDIPAVPCLPETRGTDDADRVLTMLLKNDGKPLEPFEERAAFRRLLDLGMEPGQVAKKIGRGIDYVTRRLSLGNLVPEAKAATQGGGLSVSAATELSTLPTDRQREVIGRAKESGTERLTTADIQRAKRGASYTISVKAIRGLLATMQERYDEDPTTDRFHEIEGVKKVLELA